MVLDEDIPSHIFDISDQPENFTNEKTDDFDFDLDEPDQDVQVQMEPAEIHTDQIEGFVYFAGWLGKGNKRM